MVASVLALNPIGANAEWKSTFTGWLYAEGNSTAIGWRLIDGNQYYFDLETGFMIHDTWIDGYYLGSDGAQIQTANDPYEWGDGIKDKFETDMVAQDM